MLSAADAETLIHAFISSRLDYFNSLFAGLSNSTTRGLQLLQNAAARLLTRSSKLDHIVPILASLNWLPITNRSGAKCVDDVCQCLSVHENVSDCIDACLFVLVCVVTKLAAVYIPVCTLPF